MSNDRHSDYVKKLATSSNKTYELIRLKGKTLNEKAYPHVKKTRKRIKNEPMSSKRLGLLLAAMLTLFGGAIAWSNKEAGKVDTLEEAKKANLDFEQLGINAENASRFEEIMESLKDNEYFLNHKIEIVKEIEERLHETGTRKFARAVGCNPSEVGLYQTRALNENEYSVIVVANPGEDPYNCSRYRKVYKQKGMQPGDSQTIDSFFAKYVRLYWEISGLRFELERGTEISIKDLRPLLYEACEMAEKMEVSLSLMDKKGRVYIVTFPNTDKVPNAYQNPTDKYEER